MIVTLVLTPILVAWRRLLAGRLFVRTCSRVRRRYVLVLLHAPKAAALLLVVGLVALVPMHLVEMHRVQNATLQERTCHWTSC